MSMALPVCLFHSTCRLKRLPPMSWAYVTDLPPPETTPSVTLSSVSGFQSLRRPLDEEAARFRRGVAQRLCALLIPVLPEGAALVARGSGIAHQHVDPLEGHVELVGRRSARSPAPGSAHVHLAEERLHPAARQHRDPGIELGRNQVLPRSRNLLGDRFFEGNKNRDDQGATRLQELSAGSRCVHDFLLTPCSVARA
jgi:hypothetical protein